jgi:general stress protein YciG
MARKRLRGFAAMNPQEQRRIASLGGKAAHESGSAHEFDHTEAVAAGRKGGRVVSRDRKHMAEIGRKGGYASHRNASQATTSNGSHVHSRSEETATRSTRSRKATQGQERGTKSEGMAKKGRTRTSQGGREEMEGKGRKTSRVAQPRSSGRQAKEVESGSTRRSRSRTSQKKK